MLKDSGNSCWMMIIRIENGETRQPKVKVPFFFCRRQDDGKPRRVPCESLRIAYEVGYGKFDGDDGSMKCR